ncbi:hypothetical protein F4801DRAFT_258344 [Xylaria longipes]|nr:hypothetical protein F4801DRAFT_258344 [Xylaria longipes]
MVTIGLGGHCHTDQSAKTLLEAMIKILKTTDLGIVQSVGFVAETAGVEDQLLKTGHLPLSETKVIGLVEHSIRKLRRSVRTSQVASGLRDINSDPRFALLR